ncbi:hypothetical protein CTATCC11996_08080 [Comamonas testosteroni ATCC 11996]|nr:hypothetical protein CTATCC11996_08080 [Comamonas testosteroni ATCC 11996]
MAEPVFVDTNDPSEAFLMHLILVASFFALQK